MYVQPVFLCSMRMAIIVIDRAPPEKSLPESQATNCNTSIYRTRIATTRFLHFPYCDNFLIYSATSM